MREVLIEKARFLEDKLRQRIQRSSLISRSDFMKKIRNTPVERSLIWGITSSLFAITTVGLIALLSFFIYSDKQPKTFIATLIGDGRIIEDYRNADALEVLLQLNEVDLLIALENKGIYKLRMDSGPFGIGKSYNGNNTDSILFDNIKQVYYDNNKVWFVGKEGGLVSSNKNLKDWRLHHSAENFIENFDLENDLSCLEVAKDTSFFVIGTHQDGAAIYDVLTRGWKRVNSKSKKVEKIILQENELWTFGDNQIERVLIKRNKQRLTLTHKPCLLPKSYSIDPIHNFYPIYDEQNKITTVAFTSGNGAHLKWSNKKEIWIPLTDNGDPDLVGINGDAIFTGLIKEKDRYLLASPEFGLLSYSLSGRKLYHQKFHTSQSYVPITLQLNTFSSNNEMWSFGKDEEINAVSLFYKNKDLETWQTTNIADPFRLTFWEGKPTVLNKSGKIGLYEKVAPTSKKVIKRSFSVSDYYFKPIPKGIEFGPAEVIKEQLCIGVKNPTSSSRTMLRYLPSLRSWETFGTDDLIPFKRLFAQDGGSLWGVKINGAAGYFTFSGTKPNYRPKFISSDPVDDIVSIECAAKEKNEFWWLAQNSNNSFDTYVYADRKIEKSGSTLLGNFTPLQLRLGENHLYLWGRQNGKGILYIGNKQAKYGREMWFDVKEGIEQILEPQDIFQNKLLTRSEEGIIEVRFNNSLSNSFFSGKGNKEWNKIITPSDNELYGLSKNGSLKYYNPATGIWHKVNRFRTNYQDINLCQNHLYANNKYSLFIFKTKNILTPPKMDSTLNLEIEKVQCAGNDIWVLGTSGGPTKKQLKYRNNYSKEWDTAWQSSNLNAPNTEAFDSIIWSDFIDNNWVAINSKGELYTYGLNNHTWGKVMRRGSPEKIQTISSGIWWLDKGNLRYAFRKNNQYQIYSFNGAKNKSNFSCKFWLDLSYFLENAIFYLYLAYLIIFLILAPFFTAWRNHFPAELLESETYGWRLEMWSAVGRTIRNYIVQVFTQTWNDYKRTVSYKHKEGVTFYLVLTGVLVSFIILRGIQPRLMACKEKIDVMNKKTFANTIADFSISSNGQLVIHQKDNTNTWYYKVDFTENGYVFQPETYTENSQTALSKKIQKDTPVSANGNWKVSKNNGQHQLFRKTKTGDFHPYHFQDNGFLEDEATDFNVVGRNVFILTPAGLQQFSFRRNRLADFSINTNLTSASGKLVLEEGKNLYYVGKNSVFQFKNDEWEKVNSPWPIEKKYLGMTYSVSPDSASFADEFYNSSRQQFVHDVCDLMMKDNEGRIHFHTQAGWRRVSTSLKRLEEPVKTIPVPQASIETFEATDAWTCHRKTTLLEKDDISFTFQNKSDRIDNPFEGYDRWPDERINEVWCKQDTTALATDYGIRFHVNNRLHDVELPGAKILDVEYNEGKWHCKTETGIYQKSGNSWYSLSEKPAILFKADRKLTLPIEKDLVIELSEHATANGATTELVNFDNRDNRFLFDQINDIKHKDNFLWLATNFGIQNIKIENKKIKTFNASLTDDSFIALRQDQNKNLCAGNKENLFFYYENSKKNWQPADTSSFSKTDQDTTEFLYFKNIYDPSGDQFQFKSAGKLLKIKKGKLSIDYVLNGFEKGKIAYTTTLAGLTKHDRTSKNVNLSRYDLPVGKLPIDKNIAVALDNDSLICKTSDNTFSFENGAWIEKETDVFNPTGMNFNGINWKAGKVKDSKSLIMVPTSTTTGKDTVALNKNGLFPFDDIQSVASSNEHLFILSQQGMTTASNKFTKEKNLILVHSMADPQLFNSDSKELLKGDGETIFLKTIHQKDTTWSNIQLSDNNIIKTPTNEQKWMAFENKKNSFEFDQQMYRLDINGKLLKLWNKGKLTATHEFKSPVLKVKKIDSFLWVLLSRGIYKLDLSLMNPSQKKQQIK